jgi:predicted nucleotidyltransferase
MQDTAIVIPQEKIEEFCRKWNVGALWLFGSVLRPDFTSQSDVDFMVCFSGDVRMSLLDLIRAEEELSELVGRPVDLLIREDVERSENWIRREEILNTARCIYAA